MELAPYHMVCPASFFIPLKGWDFVTNVIVGDPKNELVRRAAHLKGEWIRTILFLTRL